MLFHDVNLSRDDILQEVAAALEGDRSGIFLDTSLLVHCYEISAGARGELLSALEALKERVWVPLWAAHETWKKSYDPEVGRTPLRAPAGALQKHLDAFVTDAKRFVEDDSIADKTMNRAQYEAALEAARDALLHLVGQVSNFARQPDETSALLIPFMNARVMRSDLTPILAKVRDEAELRYSHRVPPGFMDGGAADPESDPRTGKKINRYGDVIIWFEILQKVRDGQLESLILITRDVKKDWVYIPKRLMNEHGALAPNVSVTLAHPLLVHEALQACPTLKHVHIISLDAFVQVLNGKLKRSVPQLMLALQASDIGTQRKAVSKARAAPRAPPPEEDVTFAHADLDYQPGRDDPMDKAIVALAVDDFRVQNRAVSDLNLLQDGQDRKRLIQLGLAMAKAAVGGAVEPRQIITSALLTDDFPGPVRRNLLMGVLAAIYLNDDGELRKPRSYLSLNGPLFSQASDPALEPAFTAVLSRLEPQRRQYLALPLDAPAQIPLQLLVEREDVNLLLNGVLSNAQPLVEKVAHTSRRFARLGSEEETREGLVERLATEFVVPPELFNLEDDAPARFVLPPTIGFIRWGPATGVDLR